MTEPRTFAVRLTLEVEVEALTASSALTRAKRTIRRGGGQVVAADAVAKPFK